MSLNANKESLALETDTIESLRMLKRAFEICYKKSFTNDEFIMQMAASVEEGDVAVWDVYCGLMGQKES